jgi:hypothetical protein
VRIHLLYAILLVAACSALVSASHGPKKETTATKIADRLETCDAHSPLRKYVKPVNHDTVGVLLDLAQLDLRDLVSGAKAFLSRAADEKDKVGREDLLAMLVGLIVSTPGSKVHVCWIILVNDGGKLRIGGEWPTVRMGLWRERDFPKTLATGVAKLAAGI